MCALAAFWIGWLTAGAIYKPAIVHLYGQQSPRQTIKQSAPLFDIGDYFPSILSSLSAPDTAEQESLLGLADSLMLLVHTNTFHCKYQQPQNLVHLVSAALVPRAFREYGILDWRYFQCGFCHQLNLLLVQMLNKSGFKAALRGINGHVIAEYKIDSKIYWLDADYGIPSFEKPPEEEVEEVIFNVYSEADIRTISGVKVDLKRIQKAYQNYSNDGYYNLRYLESLSRTQRLIIDIVGYSMVLLSSFFVFILVGAALVIGRRIFPLID